MIEHLQTFSTWFWASYGNSIETYEFFIRIAFGLLFTLVAIYTRNYLLGDDLRRTVFLNYMPILTIRLTDIETGKIVLISRKIPDKSIAEGFREVFDLPQNYMSSDNMKAEVEYCLKRMLGAETWSLSVSRERRFIGQIKIAGLRGGVDHQGFTLFLDKNKPRGKGYFVCEAEAKNIKTTETGEIKSIGHDSLKTGVEVHRAFLVDADQAMEMIIRSRVNERERNKIPVLKKVIEKDWK